MARLLPSKTRQPLNSFKYVILWKFKLSKESKASETFETLEISRETKRTDQGCFSMSVTFIF